MPPRDLYHDHVKNALSQDGWRITHNALRLRGANRREVTEEVEPLLAAEKDERKIAVAVRSFVGLPTMDDWQQTLAQLVLSRTFLHDTDPDYTLYLAVRQAVYEQLFGASVGTGCLDHAHLPLLIFDPRTEAILRWRL